MGMGISSKALKVTSMDGPVGTSVRSCFMPQMGSSLPFAYVPSRFKKISQDFAP